MDGHEGPKDSLLTARAGDLGPKIAVQTEMKMMPTQEITHPSGDRLSPLRMGR